MSACAHGKRIPDHAIPIDPADPEHQREGDHHTKHDAMRNWAESRSTSHITAAWVSTWLVIAASHARIGLSARSNAATIPQRSGLPGGGSTSQVFAWSPESFPFIEPVGALTGRGPSANESHRPVPGETSCLSLCWAVLDLFIGGPRGLGLSDLEYRQVVQLKIARAQHQDLVAQKTA